MHQGVVKTYDTGTMTGVVVLDPGPGEAFPVEGQDGRGSQGGPQSGPGEEDERSGRRCDQCKSCGQTAAAVFRVNRRAESICGSTAALILCFSSYSTWHSQ